MTDSAEQRSTGKRVMEPFTLAKSIEVDKHGELYGLYLPSAKQGNRIPFSRRTVDGFKVIGCIHNV